MSPGQGRRMQQVIRIIILLLLKKKIKGLLHIETSTYHEICGVENILYTLLSTVYSFECEYTDFFIFFLPGIHHRVTSSRLLTVVIHYILYYHCTLVVARTPIVKLEMFFTFLENCSKTLGFEVSE